MDYSKISFSIIEDHDIFPGKLYCLPYSAANGEESVFIRPVSFALADQTADSVFIHTFREQKLLFYCRSGEGTLCYRGYSVVFSRGMGFFLDGDALSEISSGAKGTQYTLYTITGALSEELQDVAEKRNAFVFHSNRFHDFEQRQYLLVRSFPGKLYDKEYDFSCHMNHLLVRIIQSGADASNPENDTHRRIIQQILTYMQNHLSENMNIKELAAQFHYSPSQFQKFFQEQTHSSVKQYLIRIRMQEAERLLMGTNFTVEEICTKCGFNNSNHFIRVFRQYYGKTPLQYRKRNRENTL